MDDYFDDANQELGHGNLTVPMGIGDINPLIDRLMAEARSDQFLRELVLNSIQSGAKNISITPSWVDVERTAKDGTPYYRLMIADDGSGMTGREILKFFNKFSSSGHALTVAGGNYGVGAKISCLGWNHHGMLVLSWKDGIGSAARLWYDPIKKTYGVRRFETDSGVFEEVIAAPEEYKPDFIKDHGTVIILCGNTGKEDTWLGQTLPDGPSLPNIYSHLSALNNRFFRVPDGVNINVYTMKANKSEWPRSREEALLRRAGQDEENQPRRNRNERVGTSHYVKGLEHFLKRDALESGILKHDDFNIRWYWINPDRTNLPYVMQGSLLATMFQDELYDIYRGGHEMGYFSKFGIYRRAVAKQVVIIVEPNPSKLMTDTARSHLIHPSFAKSNEKLPWGVYGDFFRANMPEVIQKALEDHNDSAHEDINKAINEDLKEYMPLMARNAFKYQEEGKDKLSDEPGSVDRTGQGENIGKPTGKKPSNTRRSRQTTSGKEDGRAAKRVSSTSRAPIIEWVTGDEEGIVDRIARYDVPNHKLLINKNYKLLRWEVSRRLKEDPSLLEFDESEKILQSTVERVYGTKLVGIIVHHHQNKDTENWTVEQWESATTPEALTLAVGGYKWAENIINRIVGPMLKKMRES